MKGPPSWSSRPASMNTGSRSMDDGRASRNARRTKDVKAASRIPSDRRTKGFGSNDDLNQTSARQGCERVGDRGFALPVPAAALDSRRTLKPSRGRFWRRNGRRYGYERRDDGRTWAARHAVLSFADEPP